MTCTRALIDVTSDSTSMSSIASRRTRTRRVARVRLAQQHERELALLLEPGGGPGRGMIGGLSPRRARRETVDGGRVSDRRRGVQHQPRLHARPPELVRGPVTGQPPPPRPARQAPGVATPIAPPPADADEVDRGRWDEDAIDEHGSWLADRIVQTWPGPGPARWPEA